jgi:hypothetical protein
MAKHISRTIQEGTKPPLLDLLSLIFASISQNDKLAFPHLIRIIAQNTYKTSASKTPWMESHISLEEN